MIDDQQVLQSRQCSIHTVTRRTAIKIVLQRHQRQLLLRFDALESSLKRLATQHGQTERVGLLGNQRDAGFQTTPFQGTSNVAGCFNQRHAACAGAGDDERFFGVAQQLGPACSLSLLLGREVGDSRCRIVEQVGDGKAKARLIGVRSVQFVGSYIIETGVVETGDEQRIALVLAQSLHRGNLPQVDLHLASQLASLALDGLTQGQRNSSRAHGDIFAEYQNGVGLFHVAQAWC